MIINFKQLGQSGGGQGGGISSGDVQTIIESYNYVNSGQVETQIINKGYVASTDITTTITSASTDTEIASAKAVYTELGNIETLLSQI